MGEWSERREVKGRGGLVFPFFLPRSNVAVNLSPLAQLWFHSSFKIVLYLSYWRNNESFRWSHRRISSALTQKRQPFATLKNFLTWTKFKIYFVKLFAVIIALKYFSLFSNLLSFFGLTCVSCFSYKRKFFFPACRSLDSYAWFSKTSGSYRRSTDESSTRNQSNFEVCVSHVILRFFTEPTCSAVKIAGMTSYLENIFRESL